MVFVATHLLSNAKQRFRYMVHYRQFATDTRVSSWNIKLIFVSVIGSCRNRGEFFVIDSFYDDDMIQIFCNTYNLNIQILLFY